MNETIDFKRILSEAINLAKKTMNDTPYWNAKFDRFARGWARLTGKPIAFNMAIFVILLWMITGPLFGFSDT